MNEKKEIIATCKECKFRCFYNHTDYVVKKCIICNREIIECIYFNDTAE